MAGCAVVIMGGELRWWLMASPRGVVLGHGAGSVGQHPGQHQPGSLDVKTHLNNRPGRGRLLIIRTLYSGSRVLAKLRDCAWE